MRKEFDEGVEKREVLLRRVRIARTVYCSFGGGVNPRLRLEKDKLLLREFETEVYSEVPVDQNRIDIVALGIKVEVGYYFTNLISVGISFARSASTVDNTLLLVSPWALYETYSYRAKITCTAVDMIARRRFSDKTGPRGYLAAALGLTTNELSALENTDSKAKHTLFVKPIKETGFRLGLGAGGEYVPWETSPLFFSGHVMAFVNLAGSEIPGVINFEATIQMGVAF